jgi:hypothetical protein
MQAHLAALCLPLALVSLAGCGPASVSVTTTAAEPEFGAAMEALASANGLSQNGLSQNGLSQNGLSQNGLSQNGLTSTQFKSWFTGNELMSAITMYYVVKCAAPAGVAITYKSPATKIPYTWYGVLGLAPDWSSGKAATTAEQQLVSACLAAHVNMYGIPVPIAVEGRTAKGAQIPISAGELTTYSWREACFFGNLFNGEGVFLNFDHSNWPTSSSSARGCAVDINGKSVACTPIVTTGNECRDDCVADPTGTFWESCTWSGKTYKPLTTRIRPQEVYTCGDGVCQFTEKCGTGLTADNCSDCGPCR